MLTRFLSRLIPTRKNSSLSINQGEDPYDFHLNSTHVQRGMHRELIGGRWDEIGQLQFDFVRSRGLQPHHRFLDVGCGSLRGGIHFIRYLQPGHYYGIDRNESLIAAGREVEIPAAGLQNRNAHLMVDSAFRFHQFGCRFHFALALSVWTHMTINAVQRCLINIAEVLEPGGIFLASYFPAPSLHCLQELDFPDNIVTHPDADPYHYHPDLIRFLCTDLPLRFENIGDWGHPRGQHMFAFHRL